MRRRPSQAVRDTLWLLAVAVTVLAIVLMAGLGEIIKMIDPVPCGCIEHPCNPSPAQTERYEAAEGLMLCAACYTLGHMPMAGSDPVLREYYESIRRVMDREARA